MNWITTTDRNGVRHYVSPEGHIIDGNGYGRMRWTVVYLDGDYGMTDTLAEAKAWAEVDLRQHAPVLTDAPSPEALTEAAEKVRLSPMGWRTLRDLLDGKEHVTTRGIGDCRRALLVEPGSQQVTALGREAARLAFGMR